MKYKNTAALLLLASPLCAVGQEVAVSSPDTILKEPLQAVVVGQEGAEEEHEHQGMVEARKRSFFQRFKRKPKTSMGQVDPALQAKLSAIYELMEVEGYDMRLVEGYRSPERQAQLVANGGGVTQVGPGRSCHQYGLAVDSAIFVKGKASWNMNDPVVRRGYMRYGELAVAAGLQWGGNWTSFKDYPHVEMRSACQLAIRTKNYKLGESVQRIAEAAPKKPSKARSFIDRLLGRVDHEAAVCLAETESAFEVGFEMSSSQLPGPLDIAYGLNFGLPTNGFCFGQACSIESALAVVDPFDQFYGSEEGEALMCQSNGAEIEFICGGDPFFPSIEAVQRFNGQPTERWAFYANPIFVRQSVNS